ncbi:ATP-binding cassette domain-containing protein [Reichenbachiella agarivorans]|uniref:ATP-binding cassette domain-containing protein n=1 Tax=Reichenbachiella agarivorans TaxID=2979464 RepID=A0ABY6CQ09_9BACT|nr:ATP-binding cassette domain-containing protein [Reichenbachiella agarivorans]UXP32586.1 ATP-binding cassette domain-containing protein [Reichenbachiella agarivorans]
MEITLDKIGKRFSNKEWIFKDLSQHFKPGDRIAITGSNGSGKSTLLKIIGGMALPTTGEIQYHDGDTLMDADQLINHVSFASPYLELIEEFSLSEMLQFHFQFKKIRGSLSLNELIDKMYFTGHEHKLIKNFSSGMKQRLKLGLCFFTHSSLVLLDEPSSNLDQVGTDWYQEQIHNLPPEVIVFVASNLASEYQFCNQIINMTQ